MTASGNGNQFRCRLEEVEPLFLRIMIVYFNNLFRCVQRIIFFISKE